MITATPRQPEEAQPGHRRPPRLLGWWLLFAVCGLYGLFALMLGVTEVLSWVGAADTAKPRAVPAVFVVHALAGGVALITGPLQFNRRLFARSRRIHRITGRTYVAAVGIASLGGLWIASFFDVSIAARIGFVVAAVLWFAATTIAFQHIRRRRIERHREWMIRSFALSLFFVTFELWRAALESSGLSHSIAYPLGILLGWSVNLLAAERRIRGTRRGEVTVTIPRASTRSGAPGAPRT